MGDPCLFDVVGFDAGEGVGHPVERGVDRDVGYGVAGDSPMTALSAIRRP